MQDQLKINQAIQAISKSNGKIAAIAYCKEVLNMGLAEAKDYVEALLEQAPLVAANNTKNLDEQIRLLLSENKELEAIKLYKVSTQSDLKTSADYVKSMMVPLNHTTSIDNESLDEKIKQLITENRKLEAIKLHKETTHSDLAFSLDYVNSIIDPNYLENKKLQKQQSLSGSFFKAILSFILLDWMKPLIRFFSRDKA
jgi:ribosomal protein L7/L12